MGFGYDGSYAVGLVRTSFRGDLGLLLLAFVSEALCAESRNANKIKVLFVIEAGKATNK